MHTKSTKEIAAALGMHPSRIEQWISREQFRPKIFAEKGLGRAWTFDEAMRLIVFIRLVDLCGMDPRTAGVLTSTGLHGFKDAKAFFVAYHGRPGNLVDAWLMEIVREPDLGTFLTSGCHLPKVLKSGYDAETMAENSRPNLGPAHAAVVVNLDQIEADLAKIWED